MLTVAGQAYALLNPEQLSLGSLALALKTSKYVVGYARAKARLVLGISAGTRAPVSQSHNPLRADTKAGERSRHGPAMVSIEPFPRLRTAILREGVAPRVWLPQHALQSRPVAAADYMGRVPRMVDAALRDATRRRWHEMLPWLDRVAPFEHHAARYRLVGYDLHEFGYDDALARLAMLNPHALGADRLAQALGLRYTYLTSIRSRMCRRGMLRMAQLSDGSMTKVGHVHFPVGTGTRGFCEPVQTCHDALVIFDRLRAEDSTFARLTDIVGAEDTASAPPLPARTHGDIGQRLDEQERQRQRQRLQEEGDDDAYDPDLEAAYAEIRREAEAEVPDPAVSTNNSGNVRYDKLDSPTLDDLMNFDFDLDKPDNI